MDATRRGEGGGWAPHVLEFMENTVLSTSWLKLGSLSARARCPEIPQCTFPETVATVLQRRKQRPGVQILRGVEEVMLQSPLSFLSFPLRELGVGGKLEWPRP